MKILVTGSEGSLMRGVVKNLLLKDHEVVGVDLLLDDRKPTSWGKKYTFIQGDLSDPKVAEYAMSGCDDVIQAAARIYGVTGFHKNCADILGNDITLHNNVLKAAVKHNVKHVTYISSSMVYEGNPIPRNKKDMMLGVKEDDALQYVPSTDYGLSKFVGERLSHSFKEQYGINYTIWRPFNIITPFEVAKEEQGFSHVFADYIQKIVIDKMNPLPILGDGNQIRCFTWIHEVAKVISDYQFDDRVINQTFNIGNKEPISMIELANLINEEAFKYGLLADQKPLNFIQQEIYADDVKVRIPNVDKIRDVLGWEANVKILNSIGACLEQLKTVI